MTSRNSSESDGRHDRFGVRNVVAGYDAEASTLVPEYERLPFGEIHAPVLDLVPESAGCVLDVGAGSGRDAAWFAAKGHQVVAVEPSAEMRAAGKERHWSPDIRWMDDALPALDKVLRSKLTFDLVWLSGVWTHVPPSTRARAFRKLVSVMSPGGSDEHHVDLLLGLVALFWVRTFRPLIAGDLPQHPAGNRRLAFVKEGFRGLAARSPHDLGIGQHFTGDDARNLIRAVRNAASCIRNMPATYTTYPGSSEPMFPCERAGAVRIRDAIRLDEAFLWSFGTLSVPATLWQAMGRYDPWIEPAVLNEERVVAAAR